MNDNKIYLDNCASTRVGDEVLEAMLPFFTKEFGNASSVHRFGQQARAHVEEARLQVADFLGASPKEIVFTSGGTESDNMAIRGIAGYHRPKGNHIITSQIEHPAVLNTCKALEKEDFTTTYLPVDSDGLVDLNQLKDAITPQTILISIMHANNEIGTLQPIKEIVEMAAHHQVLVHTDAVQTVGKIPVNVEDLGVDLLSMSGHKLHGPKGIGALYIRKVTKMRAMMAGGSHERNRRPGTENVPGIVGFGKACELAEQYLPLMDKDIRALRDRLEATVLSTIAESRVNGHRVKRVPHVSNISFAHVEGEGLLISLDLKGVAVSTGSACQSGALEVSHVLTALKLAPQWLQGALRFSLSRYTTPQEIDTVLDKLTIIVQRLREMSTTYAPRSHSSR
ncbi:MAG: cysteine desulfurase NifS [Acidobacteria bacterium]|nr:cysteine desulfurase NifS [Acidobacteriota bacterium]MBI3656234.1 cysteine desulfurase NifS [Acidobacteriota bacterium]